MIVRGAVYFGLVFAVGFFLGVVRVLWLVPQVGERLAEVAEAPLMLLAIVVVARVVIRRFPARRPIEYLVSGALALLLLVFVEFTVVLGLDGQSIGEYFSERDPIAGGLYVIMLVVFTAMPWLIGRKHAAARKADQGDC